MKKSKSRQDAKDFELLCSRGGRYAIPGNREVYAVPLTVGNDQALAQDVSGGS